MLSCRKKLPEMRLKLNLIPATSFCANLRTYLGQEKWSVLSRRIRNLHKRTCKYCGWREDWSRGSYTHLHEVWEFNLKKRVQKLVDLECICPTCHSVHHWGFSEASGYNMEYLISYACKINNCTRQEWLAYVDKCYREWAELSKIEWTLYFSKRYKIEV